MRYCTLYCINVMRSLHCSHMYVGTIVISLLVSVMVHVAVLLNLLVAIGSMKKALTARNPFETEVC